MALSMLRIYRYKNIIFAHVNYSLKHIVYTKRSFCILSLNETFHQQYCGDENKHNYWEIIIHKIWSNGDNQCADTNCRNQCIDQLIIVIIAIMKYPI